MQFDNFHMALSGMPSREASEQTAEFGYNNHRSQDQYKAVGNKRVSQTISEKDERTIFQRSKSSSIEVIDQVNPKRQRN